HLLTHNMHLFLLFLLLTIFISTKASDFSFKDLFDYCKNVQFESIRVITNLVILVLIAIIYFQNQRCRVYLLNFSCYKPDDSYKCSKQKFMLGSNAIGTFTAESIEFQRMILEKSGLGEDTYLPEALSRIPFNPCMADARKEAEGIMFGTIDELFAKINVKPKDIGILVVNCSVFTPTPSLSAMVVNRYKLRGNIMSYNIGGMGCSAAVISLELAQNLLQVHKNSYALVVSVECVTLNSYTGNEKSMLVSNCLFRLGGSAILLSNKRSDKCRSKYELVHTVRTHRGADDKSFASVTQKEDSEGKIGFSLSKELMIVAGDALKANITTLGPLVLPISEKMLFVGNLIAKKLFKMRKLKPYIPDFKLAIEHFCIHAGGKTVLDGVQKNLALTEWHMEPSRMTLYRFGNTSSTSIWYELAYTEAKGRVKRGDRVWQIAFGSGFKCNSAVWRALRSVNPAQEMNPWMDEIQSFPVDVPKEKCA
ncbi:3-ketoacyl-CoA synthase 11-like, partial [Silene latifolia]|uniref:3-ketoacyl-CoA synthase 11-like n=1 Tax=Silene latifolia TaxID=37657 RepID=UPI003D77AA6E